VAGTRSTEVWINDLRTVLEKCEKSTKSRIVKEDQYKKKDYLMGKMKHETAKKILKFRMNMTQLPGNYKNKNKNDGRCCICEEEEGTTEHYFKCKGARPLRKAWEAKEVDMRSQELKKMMDVANFMEKIEMLVGPGTQ